MRSLYNRDINPEIALAGFGVVSAAAFGLLASRTLRPRTVLGDLRMRRRIPFYGKQAKKTAFPFGYLGKEMAVLPSAGLIAAKLLADGKKPGAAAVVTATLAAVAASHIFDVTLPQKTPPPGRKAPLDPHFPSGHAMHSGALIATAAWVLGREGIADKRVVAAGGSALFVALGVDRLLQDRHWTSDVVGGWLAAIAIASVTAAGYELALKRTKKRSNRPRRRKRKAA